MSLGVGSATETRRRAGRAAAAIVTLGILIGRPGLSRAEPDEAAAAKLRGDELMRSGKPAEAVSAYTEAYAIRKDPALLYNRGRAYEALGDYPAALDQIETFERDAPPDLRGRVRGLPTLLEGLRKRVTLLTLTCDVEGAQVRLRDRSFGTTPIAPGRVNAGKATIEVAKEGYFQLVRDVDLPAGGVATVDLHLVSRQTSGQVTITSSSGAARVVVDGESKGATPIDLVVTAGSHRLELTREAYEKLDTSFVVKAGETRSLSFGLERSSTLTGQWWFWTGIGVVVLGAGIATFAALTTERAPDRGTFSDQPIGIGRF